MELTKKDTAMTKGLAILFMICLHLFCSKTNLHYQPLIYILGNPLAYYLGLFGDCCVVIYCFCSGYAHTVAFESRDNAYKGILKRLIPFILRFWIVVALFSIVGLFTDSAIPGSAKEFFLNFFMLRFSYNGAWWFVTTYIYLCLLSAIIYKIAKKNTAIALTLFAAIYLVSYLYRFDKFTIPYPQNPFFDWLSSLSAFGTSLLPYMVGMLFRKHRVFSALNGVKNKFGNKATGIAVVVIFVSMFVLHMFFESLFFAIFTGIGTIIGFNLINKHKYAEKSFMFFGRHSTNLWLTHMFFYMQPFENLAYKPKYAIFCFVFILILCLLTSYIIDFIFKNFKNHTILNKIM